MSSKAAKALVEAAKALKKPAKKRPAAPVPATVAPTRVSEAPIARLVRSGSLNVWEHTAADEILAAYQMICGIAVARDADLGLPAAEPRPDAADARAARRSDIARTYQQWRLDMQGTPPFAAVQGIVFGELPLRELEREMGWRNGSGKAHLLVGLRHYAALRGNTPAWARDWKLTKRKAAA